MFKTKFTETFGIRYPIIMGGMGRRVSSPRLAAAVANAGCLPFLGSFAYGSDKEAWRRIIKETKDLTDKPFGGNISLYPQFYIAPMSPEVAFEVSIEEGIKVFETSGRSPESIVKLAKQAGVRIIHKVAVLRNALSAVKLGVDAVSMIGWEEGGHIGPEHLGFIVHAPLVVESVGGRVPVIVGGGIGDARGFVSALACGADGVVMGTAFLVTEESPLHPRVKDLLIRSKATDTESYGWRYRDDVRALRTKKVNRLIEAEQKGVSYEEFLAMKGSHQQTYSFMYDGNLESEDGYIGCGQAIGLCNKIVSVRELIDGIINGARGIIQRISSRV